MTYTYSDRYSIPECVAPEHHKLYVRLLEDPNDRMVYFMEAYGNGLFHRIGYDNVRTIVAKWETFLPNIASWITTFYQDDASFYGLETEDDE